jgi:subtilisin family serine protease
LESSVTPPRRRHLLLFAAALLAVFISGPLRSSASFARAATPALTLAEYRQSLLGQRTAPAFARPSLKTSDLKPEEIVPGKALVTFAPDVSPADALARAGTVGTVSRDMSEIHAYEVDLPDGWSVDDGLRALATLPGSLGAEPDVRSPLDFHPNDPLYDQKQSSYLSLLHAEQAWDIQQGDPHVVVAVLDSGVDITHPDLVNRIWTNPNPGQSGCGNDLHGCNFVDPKDISPRCGVRSLGAAPNPDVSPYGFHGTMVAGVIAAEANNGIGIAGIAPHASIMPLTIGDCMFVTSSARAQAILYAIKNGARVINNSSGGESSCELLPAAVFNAVIEAQRQGVVITSSSGNDGEGCVAAPANYPGVLAVGAVSTFGDSRANFSNWGPEIAVVAPGVNIASTSLQGNRSLLPPYQQYEVESGTSFSSPMVAGLAGLLISQNPMLTGDMVATLIKKGATPLADRADTPNWAGAGRIDLLGSLRLVPAAFYGKIALPGVADGATVEARVGSQLCGSGTVSSAQSQQIYAVFVKADAEQSGCGTAGAQVSLSVNGTPAGTATWKAAAVPLDLPGNTASTSAAAPATGNSGAPAGAVLYHRGWNLVAAPAGTHFPASAGAMFTLQPGDDGYQSLQPGDALKAGFGYWAYFASDTTVPFAANGAETYSLTVPASQFVLIGNPSGTKELTVTGADLVYVYDPISGSYTQTNKLEPGQGAWVISVAGGTVTVS